MTLHLWMHWFWVTALLIIIGGSRSLSAALQSEELQHMSTDTGRLPPRQGRAMYFPKTSSPVPSATKPTITLLTPPPTNHTAHNHTTNTTPSENSTTLNITTETAPPLHINWTSVTGKPNTTNERRDQNDSITLIPPMTATPPVTTLLPVATDVTEEHKSNVTSDVNGTKVNLVKDSLKVKGAAESRTEKPLSLETEFLQTRIPSNVESSKRVVDRGVGAGMDTGAIAGISFGALVLGALAGSTAFVLYRRRYLNKPQTLNDKCSNPDSSGYLDDSTVRDNSEEMYSLDNDSFLNSLEAMTIQNYWTDTVKHTKL